MNTITETCPSLEDLAAFLEGKLSGVERARVVAHLADCPSCYEVFAEAARFQLEEEEENADLPDVSEAPREVAVPARVIPFPVKKILPWAASIAAVLAIGVSGVPLYRQYNTMPEMASTQLVNLAVAGKVAQDQFWDKWTVRGEPKDDGANPDTHELLFGAHVVDLSISLPRNEEVQVQDDLTSIIVHVDQLGRMVPEEQAKSYLDIKTRIADGKQPQDFIQQAKHLEASLPAKDYPYFAFGKWAEAGRLSALAKNPNFFKSPESRKFLRVFLRQEQENLGPEVVKALEEIRDTIDDSDPSSLPYEDLRKLFESILKHYQGESTESGLP